MKKELSNSGYVLVVLCCIVFALSSCGLNSNSSKKSGDAYEIDVRSVVNMNTADFYLSELSDGIQYVPLETGPLNLLRFISWLDITKDYIFVSDLRGLYHFDRSGRFIREIGRIGNGPGEHNGRIRCAIDKNNKEVFIYSFGTGGVNVHDLETGSFKHSFSVDFLAHSLVVLPGGSIAFFTMETEFDINEVYFIDRHGEKLAAISNHLRTKIRGNVSGNASVYFNGGELYYMYNYRDTLYHINNDLYRSPFALFTLGNQESHHDFIILPNPEANYYPNFISIPKILHGNGYMFATLQKGFGDGGVHNQDQRKMLYKKTSDELFMTNGFVNDIDGGMTFWPKWFRDDLLIDHYQPYEIIDYYYETKGIMKHSDAFIEMVNKLNENDNPVLVLLN